MSVDQRDSQSISAKVRAQLGHPIIDCDGHWQEPIPIFLDFLRDAGGAEMVDAFRNHSVNKSRWYGLSDDERHAWRLLRPAEWVGPAANTLDRATSDLPALLYDRLDEFGIDFALIYPTIGLGAIHNANEDLRRAMSRAVNTMAAELFAPYADRLTPVAAVPVYTPDEAIEELDFVRNTLGMKAIIIDANVRRPVRALADSAPEGWSAVPYYIDSLGLDSPYDYDPFWAKAVECKLAITTHGVSSSWPDRSSPSNFVYNHIGHFANAGHSAAKAIFLGGVTARFPDLNFAFLEGGVSWACQLLWDIQSHWRKRNAEAMRHNLAPDQIDFDLLRTLYARYGGERWEGRFEEVLASPSPTDPFKTTDELVAQEPATGEMSYDDFQALGLIDEDTLTSLFRDHFWFGCEADDPATSWAFTKQLDLGLQPVFSSDVGHFDVTDMTEVLHEAFELCEHGLLDEDDFKRFTFSNAASLHAGMNPEFFAGTVVEEAVADLLS